MIGLEVSIDYVSCQDSLVGADGLSEAELRAHVAGSPAGRPLGIYVHVPYCASRCGYCDFNTYTAAELGPGVRQDTFVGDVLAELLMARELLGRRTVGSVFFGGGTPTLLPAADLVAVVAAIREHFDLAVDAEITTEANPDSVDPRYFDALLAGGFTRVSLGMQSASTQVLRTLERTHTSGRAVAAAREAHAAGFRHVSLDLIYGTPGESQSDWRASLDAAVDAPVDHISAYALTLEPGTSMGAAVRRGALAGPDPDVAAERYETADEVLLAHGFAWYEISNWARPGGECAHNLAYWRSADWWGLGPGAHSHVSGARWWNVKHPRAYQTQVGAGLLPLADGEVLSAHEQHTETLMLELRLRSGMAVEVLSPDVLSELLDDGLLQTAGTGHVRLTRRGRLLADIIVTRLLV